MRHVSNQDFLISWIVSCVSAHDDTVILFCKKKKILVHFKRKKKISKKQFRSSTCFFWLLSHVIYLKLTRVLRVSSFSILQIFNFWMTKFTVFLVRGKFVRLESIHFAESSDLVVEIQKKKFCYPLLRFWKEDTLIILLSAGIDHMTQQTKEACQRT